MTIRKVGISLNANLLTMILYAAAICLRSGSLAQLFEKKLLFLLSFCIFNLEKDFLIYDRDKTTLESLKHVYSDFLDRYCC